MKKVGKLFLGLVIGATMLFAGCSSGSSSSIPLLPPQSSGSGSGSGSDSGSTGGEKPAGTVDSLPAPLLKASDLAKTIDASKNDVILFYYREDGDYSKWGLWLWPDGGDGAPGYEATAGKFEKDSGTGIAYMRLNSSLLSGATAALEAINTSSHLNFIIRDEGWGKDTDDALMDLTTGIKHYMVISGDKAVYAVTDNMSPTFKSVTAESTTTMKVVLGVKYGLKTVADSNGFTFVSDKNASIDVKDVVNYNSQSDRSKNFTDTLLVTLSSPLNPADKWTMKHEKFGSISVNVEALNKAEASKTTYTGTDLGLTLDSNGATFKVWAPLASDVKLLVYSTAADVGNFQKATVDAKASGSTTEKELYGNPATDPIQMTKDKETGVWVSTMKDYSAYKYYKYQIVNNGTTYYVCDIYAKAASGDSIAAQITDINNDPDAIYTGSTDSSWGSKAGYYNPFGKTGAETKKYNDAVIYEMHIRDWSRAVVTDSTGKFLDIANSEQILSHIKQLGVTHVQIVPMFDYSQVNADPNYNWGYNPYHYNVPEGRYVTAGYTDGTQAVKEMRTMIAKFHENGIAVNMDVVYNHTSGIRGGSLYDSTVPYYYYRVNADGSYSNGSGCGNETDSESVMFKKYMIDSLKHWMLDYHINGFRFDLMGLHSIETMGEIYAELSAIDKNVMVYGEPWSGGDSLVKNGSKKENIDQANGVACFNDTIRNAIKGAEFGGFGLGFVQGNEDETKNLLNSLEGNADFTSVSGRSINYVECHDNYTLYDKLVYSLVGSSILKKDNIVDKFIRNPTAEQIAIVKAQDKMCAALVLLSQGTPFLNGGQEFLRTKLGNPDSYSADTKGGQKWTNEPGEFCIDTCNTIDLARATANQDVVAVYKGLIALRKSSDAFTNGSGIKRGNPSTGVIWYVTNGTSDTFEVIFNSTDKEYTIDAARLNGFTKTVDITTGEVVETDTVPSTVAAKSFVILKK